jgi:hypothetical protein
VKSDKQVRVGRAELSANPELPLEQAQLLARALQRTREMLLLAEQGDWQAVTDLEISRRQDLELCFSIAVSKLNGELIAEALAVLLHLNEELLSVLTVARQHAAEARHSHSVGNAAVQIYHSTRDLA